MSFQCCSASEQLIQRLRYRGLKCILPVLNTTKVDRLQPAKHNNNNNNSTLTQQQHYSPEQRIKICHLAGPLPERWRHDDCRGWSLVDSLAESRTLASILDTPVGDSARESDASFVNKISLAIRKFWMNLAAFWACLVISTNTHWRRYTIKLFLKPRR